MCSDEAKDMSLSSQGKSLTGGSQPRGHTIMYIKCDAYRLGTQPCSTESGQYALDAERTNARRGPDVTITSQVDGTCLTTIDSDRALPTTAGSNTQCHVARTTCS